MKMPTKRCSYCKKEKTINHFSTSQWNLVKGSRCCRKCVKEREPKAKDPRNGVKLWSQTMPMFWQKGKL